LNEYLYLLSTGVVGISLWIKIYSELR